MDPAPRYRVSGDLAPWWQPISPPDHDEEESASLDSLLPARARDVLDAVALHERTPRDHSGRRRGMA